MTASLPPAFPDQGLTDDVILGTLAALRELDVPDPKGGRTTSYVYDPDRDDLEDLSLRAFALSEHVNGLDPTAFPSFAAVENDLVAAALSVLGSGDPGEVGTMTSGGTESCALAVLGARERWRAKVGDAARSPHARGAGLGAPGVRQGVPPVRRRARVRCRSTRSRSPPTSRRMVAAIDERTALVVVSAPSYAHGIVDPIEPIAAAAAERDVLCHIDACIGGWTVPFIREAEGLPPIGLMIPGVTSVSVDLHKYAYTPKGVSILLHRDFALRRFHWFATSAWNGYPVVNPTLLSSRGGGAPAIAWAYLHKIGREGYRELALSAGGRPGRSSTGSRRSPGSTSWARPARRCWRSPTTAGRTTRTSG